MNAAIIPGQELLQHLRALIRKEDISPAYAQQLIEVLRQISSERKKGASKKSLKVSEALTANGAAQRVGASKADYMARHGMLDEVLDPIHISTMYYAGEEMIQILRERVRQGFPPSAATEILFALSQLPDSHLRARAELRISRALKVSEQD